MEEWIFLNKETILYVLGFVISSTVSSVIINVIVSALRASRVELFEKIAAVVENLYGGFSSEEKLEAYIQICKEKGLNTKKAVEYLETHIIPISNTINVFEKTEEEEKEDEQEVVA